MQLTFLGGTGTVTGSKYLLEFDGRRILLMDSTMLMEEESGPSHHHPVRRVSGRRHPGIGPCGRGERNQDSWELRAGECRWRRHEELFGPCRFRRNRGVDEGGGGKAAADLHPHGEPVASDVLRQRIRRELGWESEIPEYRDLVRLE